MALDSPLVRVLGAEVQPDVIFVSEATMFDDIGAVPVIHIKVRISNPYVGGEVFTKGATFGKISAHI